MRSHYVAVLLILFSSACSRADSDLDRLYQAARSDMLKGAAPQALAHIARAEASIPESAAKWRCTFQLLKAEVTLLRRDSSGAADALALLRDLSASDHPFPELEVRRRYLEAHAHVLQGKLADALEILAGARRQAASASANEVLMDIDALEGQLMLRTGRSSEAETILQNLLARASARADRYHEAVALHNLARARILRSRFDEALAFLERLLLLTELRDYAVYGSALTHAGISYARLGQFDEAVAVQRRAIENHEKGGVPLYLEQALGELGNTYVISEHQERGAEYLSRALKVATDANLTADAAVWAGNLAEAVADLGRFDEADAYNRQAIEIKQRTNGNTLYNILNAGQIAIGRAQFPTADKLYREALERAGSNPAARWEAQAGLAKTALAAGDTSGAARHFDAALKTIQQTRSELHKAEYRVTFLTRVIRFYQVYVDTLARTGRMERALEVADSSRAIVLAERMGVAAHPQSDGTAASFAGAAKRAQSTWLSYWLGPERSYVWVVSGRGVQSATLPGAGLIEKLIDQYRQTIEHSSADPLKTPDAAGDALYKTLVAPVARFIPPGSSVRIVPDGALHGINFETLPVDGPRRHYWIEDVTVAIAPSLGLLASAAATRPQPPDPGSLLIVGDPTPRVREFPRLRYAPIEMRAVSSHFATRTARFDGDRASPKDYLAAAPERFEVIHFTAHAEANRTSPLDSAVILAGAAGVDKLYARDVADRALRANLVTISACRSAGERAYAGEGLIGFSWAFLRAGARQVIAGLWDVDDQSTATLMDNLYAGIARGDDPPAALRAAKLALMQQGGNVARPYYWGPFEVFTVTP